VRLVGAALRFLLIFINYFLLPRGVTEIGAE
jgi:hypothetical protein